MTQILFGLILTFMYASLYSMYIYLAYAYRMKDSGLLVQQKMLGITVTPKIMLLSYGIVLFSIPFLLSGPQLLVGSIVNFLLIFIALRYRLYYALIPMIMLPSVAAVLHSVVFGHFTIFLAYMMPAIRIGNLILIRFIQRTKNVRIGMIGGGFFKALFLFTVAYLLFSFGLLPVIFLKAMGVFQFITAMIGGSLALMVLRKTS